MPLERWFQTQDSYTAQNEVQSVGATYTEIQAWENPILVTWFVGSQGQVHELPGEETVVPGIIKPKQDAIGCKVRSANAGQSGVVKVDVYMPADGPYQTPVTTGGGPTSFTSGPINVGGTTVSLANNIPITIGGTSVGVTVPVDVVSSVTVPVTVINQSGGVVGESQHTLPTVIGTAGVVAISNTAAHLTGWFAQNRDVVDNYLLIYKAPAAGITPGVTVPDLWLWLPVLGGLDSLALLAQPINCPLGISAYVSQDYLGTTPAGVDAVCDFSWNEP